MMITTTLLLCVLSLLATSLNAEKTNHISVREKSWDFLVLAQFWPGTSCVYFGQDKCLVPPKTNGWTIHGLWPSNTDSEQPENCNASMPFDYDQIQDLRPQLDKQWPNFDKLGARTELWEHEWNKHGTCAYDLPVLQGELNFFNATLLLQKPLNIVGVLSDAKINPSKKKQYDLTEIFLAVTDKFNNTPQIVCCESNNIYYLEQIFLCYDKTLAPIDCPEVHEPDSRQASKAKCQEKPRLPSLRFKSENPTSVNSQDRDAKGYFFACPSEGSVLYVPIPTGQAEAANDDEAIIETDMVYESFMEKIFLP